MKSNRVNDSFFLHTLSRSTFQSVPPLFFQSCFTDPYYELQNEASFLNHDEKSSTYSIYTKRHVWFSKQIYLVN